MGEVLSRMQHQCIYLLLFAQNTSQINILATASIINSDSESVIIICHHGSPPKPPENHYRKMPLIS